MMEYNLSPLLDLEDEIKPFFSNEYMIGFFKKFTTAIQSQTRCFKKARNARYGAENFLKVFFYSEITGRSIDSASERLNKYYLKKKKGKRKIYKDGRKAREVPHQTEVNKFLRIIGLTKARKFLRTCLDCQLKEALELKLISKKVNVLIDFTEHAYYGKRDDKMIKGTTLARGTRKMRHYLGFSIISRGNHFFTGLEHIAKGQLKVPVIITFLTHLTHLGFEVNFILMDREFYDAELLEEIKRLGSDVLIPAKSYKRIKSIIEDYIKGESKRIRNYTISSAPGKDQQFSQHVYLLLKAKKGHTLLSVKRGFRRGKLTMNDAMKHIYAVMTTRRPRGDTGTWASRTSKFYKKRWNIETGFSDLNRMGRRWKSKYDGPRYLDLFFRMILYNSWKINRAYLKKCEKKGVKRRIWTLQNNQDALIEPFLET